MIKSSQAFWTSLFNPLFWSADWALFTLLLSNSLIWGSSARVWVSTVILISPRVVNDLLPIILILIPISVLPKNTMSLNNSGSVNYISLSWCDAVSWHVFSFTHTTARSTKGNMTLCKKPCSFFCWFFNLIYIDHAWFGAKNHYFRVQDLACLRVVFFYYTFQSLAQQIVFLLSYELIFFDKSLIHCFWLLGSFIICQHILRVESFEEISTR